MSATLVLTKRSLREAWRSPDALIPTLFIPLFFLVVNVGQAGKIFPVCGNTWHMLHDTRFAPHFDFIGDFSTHYGIFEGCGSNLPFDSSTAATAAGSCC